MSVHPSMQLNIARQQQRDLLARSKRNRIAKAPRAGRQEDLCGWLISRRALHDWSLPTARRAQRLRA
jgi:hypothetical protein